MVVLIRIWFGYSMSIPYYTTALEPLHTIIYWSLWSVIRGYVVFSNVSRLRVVILLQTFRHTRSTHPSIFWHIVLNSCVSVLKSCHLPSDNCFTGTSLIIGKVLITLLYISVSKRRFLSYLLVVTAWVVAVMAPHASLQTRSMALLWWDYHENMM